MKHVKETVKKRRDNPAMVVEECKPEKKLKKEDIPGLEQIVRGKKLHQIILPADVWITKGQRKATIITHNGVKKIADFAKVSKNVEYKVLTQPDAYNNYQYTMSAKVCIQGKPDDCATEIGEANRNNLNSRGKNNPASMAEKRAYDRAVFRLLGITGILSEEELSDEEEEENMDKLTHDERKHIAPAINRLLASKSQADLITFNRQMKAGEAAKLNDNQKNYLRELYKKRIGELSKLNF